MTQFHVGQKVVCIRDLSPLCQFYGETAPVVGEVYTVRAVKGFSRGIGLHFKEIRNKWHWYRLFLYCECWFVGKCFRPVVERKTDISIFKAMLNNEPQKVSA